MGVVMALDVRLCFRVVASPDIPNGLSPEVVAALRSAATLVVIEAGRVSARASGPVFRTLRAALPRPVPVLAAGRLDLALAAGLDGVLLAPDDVTPGDARRLLGPNAVVGVVVHEPGQADELYRWRADFACIGARSGEAARDAGPLGQPTPEHLNRTAFRIRLASPGTAVVAMTAADLAPARLIAADANGFMIALPENAVLGETEARDLRTRIEAALPRPAAS